MIFFDEKASRLDIALVCSKHNADRKIFMEINGQSDFFGHKLKRTVVQQSSFIEFKSKQEFKEDATKVALGQDCEQ